MNLNDLREFHSSACDKRTHFYKMQFLLFSNLKFVLNTCNELSVFIKCNRLEDNNYFENPINNELDKVKLAFYKFYKIFSKKETK